MIKKIIKNILNKKPNSVLKTDILNWLIEIEKKDGIPPSEVVAINLGLMESDQGFMMYFVGGFEYSEENDDWACIEPPEKPYRYLRLPDKIQDESWETIQNLCKDALTELENEGFLNDTVTKNTKAITTGFDDGKLFKIR